LGPLDRQPENCVPVPDFPLNVVALNVIVLVVVVVKSKQN